MPILVRQFQYRRAWSVPCGIDQHVDPAPVVHCRVHQLLQIILRFVGAGDTDAPQLFRQRFALAGRGQDAELEPVHRQRPGTIGPHVTAAGRYQSHLVFCHGLFLL